MALTVLESIAEKLEEKRKQDLEGILRVSGSNASSKNNYGVIVTDKNDVATSLVFKPLNKIKIDTNEITKAIDVDIKELKPQPQAQQKDIIPKSLYDEQVATNEDLRKKVEELNTNISKLNDSISDLKTQVTNETNNKLSVEQSNDALANQVDALSKTIDDFSKQIQSSLQKSVEESILRASLQAQNVGFKAQIEALIKQIDSLNSIIEGLQSQLGAVQQQQAIQTSSQNIAVAAGGEVINDVVVAVGIKDGIVGRINNKSNECRWERGQSLEISNNDTGPVTVTLTIQNPGGQNWLVVNPNVYTLDSGKKHKIDFGLNVGGCSYGKKDHSASYGGKIIVSAKREDGSENSKEFGTCINIQHPKSY